MNYTQVYKRYELKPAHPELNQSPGQGRSGRKTYGVYKNMQSSGLGPGGDYYLQRYQPFLNNPEQQDLNTYSHPQFKTHDKYPPPAPEIPQSFEDVQKPQPTSYSQPPTHYEPSYEARSPPLETYDAAKAQPPRKPLEEQGRNPYPESMSEPSYEDKMMELQKLQEELRKREEEVERYRRQKQSVSQSPPKATLPENSEYFDRINKSMWDKQVSTEHRKMTVQALDYQLNEKQMKNQWEKLQREQEQMQRLEHLKRLREVEAQERLNQLSRAQQYRQHLDIQRQLKQELNTQDRLRSLAPPPAETAPPRQPQDMRSSFEPKTEYERVAMQFYEQPTDMPTASSLTPFRLTKKAPKTVSFNPITGVVRDTSMYLQGDVPRPVIRSYLPEPRNQDRIVPEFSGLPAFQQPHYTSKNPKLIVTDPITMKLPKKDFQNAEFYQDAAKFFGVEEEDPKPSRMADYGAMVLQSPVIPKGSGYSYKDTRRLVQ